MALPKVSVIMPCFNLGQYLEEAVDSVLTQTYQDFEVLIVDDGSTDPETVGRLDTFARPKTTVFRTSNQGLAAARNFLLERARGEYLCALDADDRLHPQYLATTVAVLESDPALTFVSTHLQMFGTQNDIWPSDARCDLEMLLCDDTIITPALVRRSAVLDVGGYDTRMPHQGDEDWDLWMTLVERGHRGVILPDVLFYYRRRPNSMCIECTTGQVHLDLVGYLARKHAASYREHLTRVLQWKDEQLQTLRLANERIEDDIRNRLAPVVECRREELESLRRKAAAEHRTASLRDAAEASVHLRSEQDRHRVEMETVRAEHGRALAEITALRSSASWKVTAPARALVEALRRVRTLAKR